MPVRDVELSVEDSADLDDKGQVRRATLNRLLFAGPTKEFLANRQPTAMSPGSTLSTSSMAYSPARSMSPRSAKASA